MIWGGGARTSDPWSNKKVMVFKRGSYRINIKVMIFKRNSYWNNNACEEKMELFHFLDCQKMELESQPCICNWIGFLLFCAKISNFFPIFLQNLDIGLVYDIQCFCNLFSNFLERPKKLELMKSPIEGLDSLSIFFL